MGCLDGTFRLQGKEEVSHTKHSLQEPLRDELE